MGSFNIHKFFGFFISLNVVITCFWILISSNNGIQKRVVGPQQTVIASQNIQKEEMPEEKIPSTNEIKEYSDTLDAFENERRNAQENELNPTSPTGGKIVTIPSVPVDPLRGRKNRLPFTLPDDEGWE